MEKANYRIVGMAAAFSPEIANSFFVWLHSEAYGILVPQPGIAPMFPAVEASGPNRWTAREVPCQHFLKGPNRKYFQS